MSGQRASFGEVDRSKSCRGVSLTTLRPSGGVSITFVVFLIILIASTYVLVTSTKRILDVYEVSSSSMAPTIVGGERILVNRWLYEFSEPQRGDVVILKYPLDKEREMVKRVVGLPGETIETRDGDIYINGEVLDTELIPKEKLHENREIWQFGQTGSVIAIPKGHYFVLGDYSSLSEDSRRWGPISRDLIEGKALYRFKRELTDGAGGWRLAQMTWMEALNDAKRLLPLVRYFGERLRRAGMSNE